MSHIQGNKSTLFFLLKLIFVICFGIVLKASIHSPSVILAQTNSSSFPGQLIVEGDWDKIGEGHELIKLNDDLILDWETATGQYRTWYYDPTITGQADPFLEHTTPDQATLGALSIGHNLTFLGMPNLLNWEPISGEYIIQKYNPAITGNGDSLSTQSTLRGTFKDINSEHRLITLDNEKILDWEPATGQYRIWRYDQDLVGQVDTFPGQLIVEGIWPTIGLGHELTYLGNNRLLDWEPATGHYRIWRYDPMVKGNENPLVGEPVAEGIWNNLGPGHRLVNLGNNRLLDWKPATGKYSIWSYELGAVGAYTLADVAARFEGNTVSGITVITHGFQLLNDQGDVLMLLAEEIHKKSGGWLLDYDLTTDSANGFFDTCEMCTLPAPDSSETGEVVLLFDWAPESNELYTDGWGEAAGEGLFSIIVGLGLVNPSSPSNPPIHFIGHSFGTAVTSEAIERLAYFGVPVDHVTYLDPHDFNEGLGFDGSQRLFDLGKPAKYGAAVWSNVAFADVYYQTRSAAGSLTIPPLPPDGRPIPGAYNKFLNAALPDINTDPYPIDDFSGDHSYVWNCFYLGTVIGTLPTEEITGGEWSCAPLGTDIDLTETGYKFSRITGGQRPAPVFYGSGQGHKHSNPQLVVRNTGEPNQAGLDALGLNPEDITEGHWEPEWEPLTVLNGDFEHYNIVPEVCAFSGENSCPQPGWSHHGGGGRGHFNKSQNNAYLILDGGIFGNNEVQAHNWLYIPTNAAWLQFDLRRQVILGEDKFEVYMGDQLLQSYEITGDDPDYITRKVVVPEAFKGHVSTITFKIKKVGTYIDSEAWIDNVKFIGEPIFHIHLPTIFNNSSLTSNTSGN